MAARAWRSAVRSCSLRASVLVRARRSRSSVSLARSRASAWPLARSASVRSRRSWAVVVAASTSAPGWVVVVACASEGGGEAVLVAFAAREALCCCWTSSAAFSASSAAMRSASWEPGGRGGPHAPCVRWRAERGRDGGDLVRRAKGGRGAGERDTHTLIRAPCSPGSRVRPPAGSRGTLRASWAPAWWLATPLAGHWGRYEAETRVGDDDWGGDRADGR